MDLKQFFKKLGYDLEATEKMATHIENWKSWYRGEVATFHNYKVYNGDRNIPLKRLSLQMAKKVSEDWANLLLNEKVEFVCEADEKTNDSLNDVLVDNDFWVLGNHGIELSFAFGTGAFVLGLEDMTYDEQANVADATGARINVEFVPAQKCFPLSYEGNDVTECAFATRKIQGKNTYVYVSIHSLNERGNYEITNYVLQEKGKTYTDVTEEMKGFLRKFDTGSAVKWFSIYRPNIINNIQFDNPYGISVFGNAISALKSLDIIYDSFANEFILGRKRIFVSAEALKVDISTGETKMVFDPNDVIFYALPPDMDGKEMIKDNDMTIRTDDHEKAIYMQLNILSAKCGFGERHYKFDQGSVTTATQIISENSTLFRTLKKHEIELENTLYDLFKGILYIGKEFLGLPMNPDAEIVIKFDDSIIEDKNTEMTRDLQLCNSGIMNKWEYRAKYFNETPEEAKKKVPQAEVDLFPKPGEGDE